MFLRSIVYISIACIYNIHITCTVIDPLHSKKWYTNLMAIRVNHCIVFKFESINDICSALININDVVCCSLDIGGCIAAETLCILCVVS